MTSLDALLAIAIEATRRASQLMRNQDPGRLTDKGDRDYASEVDFSIERNVRAFLARTTPEIGFLGEEEGPSGLGDSDMWTLDPVDGTVNFAHGIPLCGISLALVRDGRPVLGIVDLPFLWSRYTAVQGGGAHLNGRPIQVSSTTRLRDAVVNLGDYAVGEDAERKNAPRLAITAELAHQALRIRMVGSAAIDLVWVAEGKADACVALSNKPWDVSAGVIIAREAGARVVDSDGSDHAVDSHATIAAPADLISELISLIQRAIQKGPGSAGASTKSGGL